jgi:hypothetical protein
MIAVRKPRVYLAGKITKNGWRQNIVDLRNRVSPDDAFRCRRRIHALSERRIDRADFVFAYINAGDCYGTLVELGYARKAGKPVFIAFADALSRKTVEDLWFPQQGAMILRGSPRETFEAALRFLNSVKKNSAAGSARRMNNEGDQWSSITSSPIEP